MGEFSRKINSFLFIVSEKVISISEAAESVFEMPSPELRETNLLSDGVHSVDDPWNVSEQRQQEANPELHLLPSPPPKTQTRKKDEDNK